MQTQNFGKNGKNYYGLVMGIASVVIFGMLAYLLFCWSINGEGIYVHYNAEGKFDHFDARGNVGLGFWSLSVLCHDGTLDDFEVTRVLSPAGIFAIVALCLYFVASGVYLYLNKRSGLETDFNFGMIIVITMVLCAIILIIGMASLPNAKAIQDYINTASHGSYEDVIPDLVPLPWLWKLGFNAVSGWIFPSSSSVSVTLTAHLSTIANLVMAVLIGGEIVGAVPGIKGIIQFVKE